MVFNHIIPFELKLILTGLRNEIRVDIIDLLYQNPQLSLTELSEALELQPNSLSYHIKELENAGLVRKTIQRLDPSPDYAYYYISPLGKRVVENLLAIFKPAAFTPPFVQTKPKESSIISAKRLSYSTIETSIDSNKQTTVDNQQFLDEIDLEKKIRSLTLERIGFGEKTITNTSERSLPPDIVDFFQNSILSSITEKSEPTLNRNFSSKTKSSTDSNISNEKSED